MARKPSQKKLNSRWAALSAADRYLATFDPEVPRRDCCLSSEAATFHSLPALLLDERHGLESSDDASARAEVERVLANVHDLAAALDAPATQGLHNPQPIARAEDPPCPRCWYLRGIGDALGVGSARHPSLGPVRCKPPVRSPAVAVYAYLLENGFRTFEDAWAEAQRWADQRQYPIVQGREVLVEGVDGGLSIGWPDEDPRTVDRNRFKDEFKKARRRGEAD